jgi:hypothetical protein
LAAEGVEDLGETGKKKPKLDDRKPAHAKGKHGDKPRTDKPRTDKPRTDKPKTDKPKRPRQRTRAGKPAAEV